MMQISQDFFDRRMVSLNMMTNEQCRQIHLASLEVLERAGVDVQLDDALILLNRAGADVRDPSKVKIPSALVDWALRNTPKKIMIYDRSGSPALRLEGRNGYYGTGTDTLNVIDLETGQRRMARGEDVDRVVRLTDALDQIDFIANMGSVAPDEVPPEISDRHNFARMLKNSTKPILFTAWELTGIRDIHEMALAVRDGDEKTFRNTPFIIQYAEPVSPLCHPAASLQKLMFCAEKGIPVTYASGATMGGTAPATAAGALVLSNAEFLSGLVIAQLTRKGAPIIYGGGSSPLDMNTMACIYAGPDALHNFHMVRELSAYYGLPDFNFGGYSDSKVLDMQAAAEVAISIFQTGLAGSSLVHDVGYLEAGITASLELIVFANEIISQIRHFRKMPPMDAEALAVEAICQVGSTGNFIDQNHTFRHFNKIWYPSIFDRRNYEGWQAAGQKDMGTILREKVYEILELHQAPELQDSALKVIDDILARVDWSETRQLNIAYSNG